MDSTPTMAGLLVLAGAARPVPFAPAAPAAQPARHLTTWTAAVSAHPATYTVFGGKNRRPRPLSELSP